MKHHFRTIGFGLFTLISFLYGCKGIFNDPNTTRHTFTHEGIERCFVKHIPSGYDASNQYPLIIMLHGGGGGDKQAAKHYDWMEKSDDQNFIVIFPKGEHHHWNDSRGTTKSSEEGLDDVGFIEAVIDEVKSDNSINDSLIFITGISNGAFMTYKMICESSIEFKAAAPVVATLPEKQECNQSIPILIILGTEDVYIPYEGGEMEKGAGGKIKSGDETFEIFQAFNGCSGTISKTTLDHEDDDTKVVIKTSEDCSTNFLTILYKIEGGGHEWAGASGINVANKGDGHRCEEFNATDVVWDFFKTQM